MTCWQQKIRSYLCMPKATVFGKAACVIRTSGLTRGRGDLPPYSTEKIMQGIKLSKALMSEFRTNHLFCQANFKIALHTSVGFFFSLLVTEILLNLGESAISFSKEQGWCLNPF